jgi:tetratricopeptide (TPR) repeat protein
MRWVVFAPLLLLLWRRDKALLAVFATFGVQVLYSIQVGGDAWEWSGGSNRFIAIVMPMFLVLSSMLLGDVYGALARRVSRTGPARVALLALLRAGGVASVLALLVALNYHGSLRQSIERWTLRQRPLYVLENRQHVKLAREVERLTTTDATLAVVWAGSLPYYTGRTCVDLLGKSDRTVARGPVRMEPGAGPRPALEPGHFKWDYDHSLGSGKPDVIVETWYRMETHPEWAHYFAHDLGLSGSVYVREGSQHIRLPEADLLASREWWRGLWLEQRGDLDAAIAAFVHAIATGPYNETWRYRFGKLLVEQRPLADVEAYYDSTAQRDPKPQTSHFFRAVALAQAGRFDEAIAWFERALEVDPAHEMSHEAWGDVLVAQGRLAEATLHYNAALRILPEYRSARLRLADALSRLGRMNDAERERSIARNQVELTDARRYFSWGKFLLDIGRPEAAAAELERALAVDPDNREAKRLLHQARGATHAAADRHR